MIPAYNEAGRIQNTIRAVQTLPYAPRILVVNDGSTDNTAAEVRETGVEILDLSTNMGKGGAMNAAAQVVDSDIIVFLDADLEDSASQAGVLIEPVMAGTADLVIAAFPPPVKKGGFGLVKGSAAWVIFRVGGLESMAPLSGQRAMTRELMKAVTPFSQGFGVELGMTLRALMDGFKVVEVPTTMSHRETGRNIAGFVHRGRQFVDVIRTSRNELKERGL